MKILALERELQSASAGDTNPLLKSEAAVIWELYQQGVIRELYFNAEQHTAILVLECDNLDSARRLLDHLPLVEAGKIIFDVVSLMPYDGFDRLFIKK